jgi:hypothetical protein
MAVFRPRRNGKSSKFFVCDFIYQGKRFQESTGATTKTLAKEYEKSRRAELERAAVGLPTEQNAQRVRTVADVITPYVAGYKLNHRPKSVLFVEGRLAQVKNRLGNVVLSDLKSLLKKVCRDRFYRPRNADRVTEEARGAGGAINSRARPQAHAGAAIKVTSRRILKAALAKTTSQSTLSRPRSLIFRSPAMLLNQPKTGSIRGRAC